MTLSFKSFELQNSDFTKLSRDAFTAESSSEPGGPEVHLANEGIPGGITSL